MAQDRESSPAETNILTTMLRHQPIINRRSPQVKPGPQKSPKEEPWGLQVRDFYRPDAFLSQNHQCQNTSKGQSTIRFSLKGKSYGGLTKLLKIKRATFLPRRVCMVCVGQNIRSRSTTADGEWSGVIRRRCRQLHRRQGRYSGSSAPTDSQPSQVGDQWHLSTAIHDIM